MKPSISFPQLPCQWCRGYSWESGPPQVSESLCKTKGLLAGWTEVTTCQGPSEVWPKAGGATSSVLSFSRLVLPKPPT